MCDLGRFDTRCNRLLYFLASRFMAVVCCHGAHPFFDEYKSWASISGGGIFGDKFRDATRRKV